MLNVSQYKKLARNIREAILEIAYQRQSHHLGSALSIVDLLTVLYFGTLKINPKKPKDPLRDRFILSKGHACLAWYVTLAKRGFFSEKTLLKHYAIDGGKLGLHPDKDSLPGIEATTGSLGHGLSVGVGLALAAKINNSSYRTFVIIGDGECNEGTIWEAAMFAAQHKLDNLCAILDCNQWQAFGRTKEVIDLEPLFDKWSSFGWANKEIDGHNLREIIQVFDKIPFQNNKPNMIIAHTVKGKGVSFLEDKLESHYKRINQQELAIALEEFKKYA